MVVSFENMFKSKGQDHGYFIVSIWGLAFHDKYGSLYMFLGKSYNSKCQSVL